MPPGRLVGQPGVGDRLDELAGQTALVLDIGIGRHRLAGEKALLIGGPARHLDLALGEADPRRAGAGGRREGLQT